MKTKEGLCNASQLSVNKIVLSIFFLLVLCRTAGAQDARKAILSAADAGTCTANSTACSFLTIHSGAGGVTFTITANASANTIQFEATGDTEPAGSHTWVALNVFPSNSTTAVTSTTSTGTWQANIAGFTQVRLRCSTFIGGTTTTYINLSTASARSGGGGNGAVSGPLAFNAMNYGVLADTQINWAPVWTNASNIVTCATCNFLTTAKVGQIIFGTNADPLGSTTQITSVVQLPQTTILSIDSNTQIHTVGNANATWSVKGPLIWGSDDTQHLLDAWTATTNACGALHVNGYMLTQKALFTTAPVTNCTNPGAASRQGPSVIGDGINASIIIPTPSFDATTCTGVGSACFFGISSGFGSGILVRDLTIWGAGNSAIGAGFNGKVAAVIGADAILTNFIIAGWGGGTTGFTGLLINSYPVTVVTSGVDSAGAQACKVSSGSPYPQVFFYGVFCGDAGGNGGASGLLIGTGGLVSVAGTYPANATSGGCSVEIQGTGILQSQGDVFGAATGSAAAGLCVNGNGATANVVNGIFNMAGGANTGIALDMLVSGAIARISQSKVAGGSSGTAVVTVSGSKVFDDGGNTFSGGTLFSGAGALFGSDSITGTTQTTGNIALTSGWGTSTVTSASGDSHREKFAISVTGVPGASPVLTVTFPTAFLVAPSSCSIQEVSGTFGIITNPSFAAPTTTSVAITFAGTPVATNTYTFELSCGP